MDALALWFSFRGRVNRARFLLVAISNLVLAFAGIAIIVSAIAPAAPAVTPVVMIGWFVLLNVSWLAIAAKRLHDLDYRAWWLLGLLAVVAVIMVVTDQFPTAFVNEFYHVPRPVTDILIPWVVVAILGAIRGTRGPNRFGPDPLAARDALATQRGFAASERDPSWPGSMSTRTILLR